MSMQAEARIIVDLPDPPPPVTLPHTHGISEVAGLAETLTSIAEVANGAAPADHTHPPPALNGLKTVMHFGAVGDDIADDLPAFNAALAWSEANDLPVIVPNRRFKIGGPIATVTTRNHFHKWGFIGVGGALRAAYSDASLPLISIRSRHVARFLTLTGMTLRGDRTQGHGVFLAARDSDAETTGNLYNADISHLDIEGFLDGVHVNGEVFESFFTQLRCLDHARDGFRFGHGKDPASGTARGVCTAIHLTHFIAAQNGRYGVATDNWMTDIAIEHGYIRESRQYGLRLHNGTMRAVKQVGFENNFLDAEFTEASAHIFTRNMARFGTCWGYNGAKQGDADAPTEGAKYLIHKQDAIGGDMSVRDCRMSGIVAVPAALARLTGVGHTHVQGSTGSLTVESPALYTADFCSGAGLNPTGRVTNVA